MNTYLRQIADKLNNTRTYLILTNALLVFFLILLSNVGVLPFKGMGDFAFFTVLALILTLYRPGWGFLFSIGTIALENINLAPESAGIMIRPYQLFGGLTVVAILIRWILKRINLGMIKLKRADYLIILITVAGFVSILGAADKGLSLKLSAILASFAFLYLLARTYIQSVDDLKKIIPFVLSSGIVIIFYGIWQNVRFMKGLESFETMPGRSNATFAEADWLGMYLVLLLAAIYSLVYYLRNKNYYADFEESKSILARFRITTLNSKFLFLYIYLVLIFILLIITVSRSAWLGAFAVTFIYLLVTLSGLSFKNWQWKSFLNQLMAVFTVLILASAYVYTFNLTNFQLLNRIQSTSTGLQKITIACENKDQLEKLAQLEQVKDVDQLGQFNCRHINLEDIESERDEGFVVAEIYRDDPNVSVRSEIYRKSWEEIKRHPILGIGWGNMGAVLGKAGDGAGLSANDTKFQAELNSSNIFLQVWLGSGIAGVLAFVVVWLYILVGSIKRFLQDNWEVKVAGLFILLGLLAVLIPNMFNAGLFLGFLWLYLGLAFIE